MSTTEVRPHGTGLRGAGAPGLGGYVLAVLASAGVLALTFPLSALLAGDVGWPSGFGELFAGVAFVLVVVGYALFFGWPAALVGCVIVHVVCLPVREQVVHVAMAALTGLAAGVFYDLVLFDGDAGWLWLQLTVATGLGRAAVIPLARRRMP